MDPARHLAIEQALCASLCAEVRLVSARGKLWVRTPFTFPDGDHYVMRLEELPGGGVRLSDNGHTLMHLSYTLDSKLLREGKRAQVLEPVLLQHGVTLVGGVLSIDSTFADLGRSLVRFAQTLTSIADLDFLRAAHVVSTFYDDLAAALETLLPGRWLRNHTIPTLENGNLYPVDYAVIAPRPLYVWGAPSNEKVKLVTVILHTLRAARVTFDSIVVFQNQAEIGRSDLARLSDVGGDLVSSLQATDQLRRKVGERIAFT